METNEAYTWKFFNDIFHIFLTVLVVFLPYFKHWAARET